MPNDEVMIWVHQLVQWIVWYEYVQESGSWIDSKCPDNIKDDPSLYNNWLNSQKNKEKSKINNPYSK